jgi:hypothetical protein
LEVVLLADLLEHLNLPPSKLVLRVREQGLDHGLALLEFLFFFHQSLKESDRKLFLPGLVGREELFIQPIDCSSDHLQGLSVEITEAGIRQLTNKLYLQLASSRGLLEVE